MPCWLVARRAQRRQGNSVIERTGMPRVFAMMACDNSCATRMMKNRAEVTIAVVQMVVGDHVA